MLEADDETDSEDSDSDAEHDDMAAVERSLDAEAGEQDDAMVAEPGAGGRMSRRAARAAGGANGSQGGRGDPWAFDADDGSAKQLSFDIYVKGNVLRPTSFFKAAEGQVQRFRMFPYFERRRRVDAFGEVIDVAMWMRKGKVLEEGAESEETKEAKRKKQAEDEAKVW